MPKSLRSIKRNHLRKGRFARVRRSRVLKALLAQKATALTGTAATITPTALATGVFTLTAHGLKQGDGPYTITFGTTQPTGLPAAGPYFIATVPDANSFTVTSKFGDRKPLIPTTNGSGTITMKKGETQRAGYEALKKPPMNRRRWKALTDADNF